MNGSKVSAATQATIYAGTRQITSITHAHDERRNLEGSDSLEWDRSTKRVRGVRKLRGQTMSTYIT